MLSFILLFVAMAVLIKCLYAIVLVKFSSNSRVARIRGINDNFTLTTFAKLQVLLALLLSFINR